MISLRTSCCASTTTSRHQGSSSPVRGAASPNDDEPHSRVRTSSGLVATIRSGPPPGFFRIGWVRRLANLNEFFVHHEDVRRANGRGPRTNSPAMDAALWRNVSRAPWFLARRLRGAGLELQWAGTAHTIRARRGEPTVRIAGPPGELLLYLFGRQHAARVEVSGPPDAVNAVRRARFGM